MSTKLTKKKSKEFTILIFRDWCKRCGICVAFCPCQVLETDMSGFPTVSLPEKCIGCGLCEIRCPDYAIEVTDKE